MLDQLMQITLFGNFFIFLSVFIAWFIILIYSEVIKEGSVAAVGTVVFIIGAYVWGTSPFEIDFDWRYPCAYLVIGFIYSLVRTYLFSRKEAYQVLKRKREIELGLYSSEYVPQSFLSHITRWWFLWPISLLVWMFTDVFTHVTDFLVKSCKSVYEMVSNWAVRSVKLEPMTADQEAILSRRKARLEEIELEKLKSKK